ncbi:DUF1801 domain-containing protein [Brevundimonas sp.]|uniref:DUF1801 domain-containing protein n=1 Tax=Brevundimonas sp. TaxID=1871086 RepID=UPI002737B38B|nr:DUF1801 domain-containing protein [Brevundimonas sp.]MDP3800924.1 DUF1801 domain-containing protein [Brevundimonas sp.]
MEKGPVAANPDAWVAGLDGWRRDRVEALRAAIRTVDGLTEVIKWGHLVYLTNGPALLIRAEGQRVLLGFWRGQRLGGIEPRLKPGGQYEMATLSLASGEAVDPETVTALTRAAVALNAELGDPTKALKKEKTR